MSESDAESNAESDADGTVAWRELLVEATKRFESGDVPDPANSARRIVEEAAGIEPREFAFGLDEPVTQRSVVRFDRMVSRRLEGEPLQYVVGRWSFRTLDLIVDRRVLIPRPETEVVAGKALDETRRFEQPVVVDLGTGSGAIGLSVAVENRLASVVLTDCSADALAVARANLTGLGRAAIRVSVSEGRWFEAVDDSLRGAISVIVSNPPYVATTDELPSEVADWEPAEALLAGATGLSDLELLIAQAPQWLQPGGSLVLEMAPLQTAPMADLARQHFDQVEVFADLTDRPRGLIARNSAG